MSISEARSYIDVPPVAPAVGGVLSVARVVSATGHSLLGMEYLTDACAEGGEWADMCAFDATIANCVPPPQLSTGATAGTPGTWTPGGSLVPTRQNIISGQVTITPSPATPWTTGQYIVTSDGVEGYWDGSAWKPGRAPAPVIPATGATAGAPGSWTPAGSVPPANPGSMAGITASPATAWTPGQYVQTQLVGAAGQVHWSGTAWVAGPAPALAFDPFDWTINEVQDHVNGLSMTGAALTAEIQRILDAERASKNRATLVSWLDQFPGVV